MNTKTESLIVAISIVLTLGVPTAWMWLDWYASAITPGLSEMLFHFALFFLFIGFVEIITLPLMQPFWLLLVGGVAIVVYCVKYAYNRLLSAAQPRY